MRFNYCVLSIAIFSLSACAWVEPTPQSEQVSVVKSFNVKSCKLLRTSTVSVTQKVGIITRGDERVKEELIILAKNKAGEIVGILSLWNR